MPSLSHPSGEGSPEGGPQDTELVERVRQGDADAFDELVSRHMRRAYRIAYRLLGHREDAEDLVQEAFLAVLERIDTFEAGREFGPWFNRIVVNRGLNARKARDVRRTEAIPDGAMSATPSPARHAEQVQIAARVREAVESLPDRQRVIVELFELEGFSGPEIAEMLEISPGTVRWHLHAARETLRGLLATLERKE
jgi:RNA polymerase sigma-70 factor, ECF subfamily